MGTASEGAPTVPRRWTLALRGVSSLALVVALAGLLSPPGPQEVLSAAAIGLVLLGPVLRVAVPAWWWRRRPDRRFLLIAALVALVVPAAAAALAASAG